MAVCNHGLPHRARVALLRHLLATRALLQWSRAAGGSSRLWRRSLVARRLLQLRAARRAPWNRMPVKRVTSKGRRLRQFTWLCHRERGLAWASVDRVGCMVGCIKNRWASTRIALLFEGRPSIAQLLARLSQHCLVLWKHRAPHSQAKVNPLSQKLDTYKTWLQANKNWHAMS